MSVIIADEKFSVKAVRKIFPRPFSAQDDKWAVGRGQLAVISDESLSLLFSLPFSRKRKAKKENKEKASKYSIKKHSAAFSLLPVMRMRWSNVTRISSQDKVRPCSYVSAMTTLCALGIPRQIMI